MSVLEVVCAVWVFFCSAVSILTGWETATVVGERNAASRIAADCADNAAERWLAGAPVPASYVVDGAVCKIEVSSDDSTISGYTSIRAVYQGATQELWLDNL